MPSLAALIGLMAVPGATAVMAQAPHAPAAHTRLIWSGVAGGFRWRWTTADLTAARPGASTTAFSAAATERRTNPVLKDDGATPSDDYFECSIRPLSVVGRIASYERDYYWEGGAHPSGSTDYYCVDAGRPRSRLSLTDLFPDAAVLRALLADKVVAKILRKNSGRSPPRNAAQLVQLLKGKSFGGDEEDQFAFGEDLLQRFAFHHIEGNRVAIRLCIGWSTEIYRFSTTPIGILLPIPPALRLPLTLAAGRKEGFLMAHSRKLAGEPTTLLFTVGKTPR